jgi:hypothetical protein
MKKILLFFVPTVLIFILSCKPSVKEALAYNDTIVYYHEEIHKKIAFLNDTYNNYVPQEMDKAYSEAKKVTEQGINFVDSLEAFHDDDSYRKASLELFKTYKLVLDVEHVRIMELLKLPEKKFQQAEIEELDRLKEISRKKIESKIEEVAKIQDAFAKKFNYEFNDKDTL